MCCVAQLITEARADEETWALGHEFVLYFQGQVLRGDENLLHAAGGASGAPSCSSLTRCGLTYVEPVDVNLLKQGAFRPV